MGQHLVEGEQCSLVYGQVDPVVSDASTVALLSITCDEVYNLAEAGHLLDVNVNQGRRAAPVRSAELDALAQGFAAGPTPGGEAPRPRWRTAASSRAM